MSILSETSRFEVEPLLSANSGLDGSLPSLGPAEILLANKVDVLLKQSGLDLSKVVSNANGFLNLSALAADKINSENFFESLRAYVKATLGVSEFIKPTLLNVTDSNGIHSKIYVGEDYSQRGPVIVSPEHLSEIFSDFDRPAEEEIANRVAVGKQYYGTMPGIESAYTGKIVRAMQARTIFIIGEHRGALTDYVARCAFGDTLIFTMDLPQSMRDLAGVRPVNAINQSFINYTEAEIGQIWRTSGQLHAKQIVGFLGDSTHEHSEDLFNALAGSIDLVIVDGNHEYGAVLKDLQTAARLVSAGGVVILDDFWKPARLFEVSEAALRIRREIPELSHLYHLSWGAGDLDDQINSNLAFFVHCASGQD